MKAFARTTTSSCLAALKMGCVAGAALAAILVSEAPPPQRNPKPRKDRRMSDAKRTAVALATLVALLVPQMSHARDVKRCGLTIGAGKICKLVKDVQCGYRCAPDPTRRCSFNR